jgi:hypothetical protein
MKQVGPAHRLAARRHRKRVLRKLNAADGFPGVADRFSASRIAWLFDALARKTGLRHLRGGAMPGAR